MKKTGSLLKEKRESSSLSISEVALATKINPRILTAIENGDEAHLPSKTFLKGFIRSYALFLKMDVDEVLRSYQDEMGGPPPEQVHEAYRTDTPPATGRRRVADENSSGMRTLAIVAIVILIGLIIGVRELIEKYQREKVIETTETLKVSPLNRPVEASPSDTSKVLSNTNAVVEVPAESAPKAADTEAKAEVKAEPVKAEPIKVEPPKTDPPKAEAVKVEAPKVATPVVDVKPAVVQEQKTEVKADSVKPGAKVVKSEIIIEALDKVELQIKIKGQTRKIKLSPLEVHTIHAEQPVVVDFSDGGAVNVIVDGRDRGVPGELGKPKQISVP